MAAGLRAIDPGLFTTVQDLGRLGYREWGVPIGGAFDRRSTRVANALLGNRSDDAVLELTVTGGVFQAECRLAIALAGAKTNASILGMDGRERPFRTPGCGMIALGEKLIIGRIRGGARVYLAVRGGWQTPVYLGSRSTEQRLQAGDFVPAMEAEIEIPSRHLKDWGWAEPGLEAIHILEGPEYDCLRDFDPSSWEVRSWRVGSQSNRMGLRLYGSPVELSPSATAERLSAPVAPGAIQVAGGGLIVLGVASGTIGGYPHVAHVISADLWRLGQIQPGKTIRFQRISLRDARDLDSRQRIADRAWLSRIASVVG